MADGVGFTFGPFAGGDLRCGCHDHGTLLYQQICECLNCGATWLLYAERWVQLAATDPDGNVRVRLAAILPNSGPASAKEGT